MKKELPRITAPALGCMMGTAYQTLLSRLSSALINAGLDVTTTEYLILRALYTRDGIQQCEIAELTGKDKSAVCRMVAYMEKKGLVRTESVSHKCIRVYVARKGRSIESTILKVAEARHRALEALASEEELKIFTKILENIITEN